MSAKRIEFGIVDGSEIEAVVLSNAHGMTATVITLGATLQSLLVPDRRGRFADVVLGYATASEYANNPQFIGSTVGRYANRIARGRFELQGKQYQLDINDGPNHLHGGKRGFDKAIWQIESQTQSSVSLSHVSPDGEGGYPGTMRVTATYMLHEHNELTVEYRAITSAPTLANITHHSYFNLSGEGSGDILLHRLQLHADEYTPIDDTSIPTGERCSVANTPFDFRVPRAIGDRIRDGGEQMRRGHGYDHNFVVREPVGQLACIAAVDDPESGRCMQVFAATPGLQFYSGNFLNGTTKGKRGNPYDRCDGFCLEPQHFPDSPNRPEFPSAQLNPGDEYRNRISFRFS